ncbi:MAG: glycoside hydrolase family 2 [Planctomycetota bacterium]|nr:glycoside hydrolase family 2 [Planctomycetota bacterium]
MRTIRGTIIAMVLLGLGSVATGEWRPAGGPLLTRWAKDVSPESALPEYPRPQMVRADWRNLNGLWNYAVRPKEEGRPDRWDGSILVPFPIESALSGVMRALEPSQRLWYRRQFTVPKEWAGRRVLLHFGAVDWEATVWLNGKELGAHRGGYDEFSWDITAALKADGPQDLVVAVFDPTDAHWQLHGKQSLRPAGCSYTACSGIWQTVWIEPVPEAHVERLVVVPGADAGAVRLTVIGRMPPVPVTVEATALDGKKKVAGARAAAGGELTPAVRENLVSFYRADSTWFSVDADLVVPGARPWSPDDPFLYDLTVELKDAGGKTLDTVGSYFGVRRITIGTDEKGSTRPLLNGRVLIMPGALDQGYWPDGIYTAPTDEALRYDIEAARRLGLNAVRKHVKTEPQRWYYWADRLGLLVLQDMPTGSEGDARTDRPRSPEAAMQCEMEKRRLIDQLRNHPSIIMWILFNEGWGQHDTLRYAQWAKDLDPTRLIDEASGFPWHGGGDVVDTHGGLPPKDPRRIGITSETGGYGVNAAGHSWSPKVWTYLTFDPKTGGSTSGMENDAHGRLPPLDDVSRRWMTRQVRGLFRSLWLNKDADGRSGVFFCQLADVETECNGLMSYDRAVFKVDPDAIRAACRGEQLPADVVSLVPCASAQPTTWRYTTEKPAEKWSAPDFDDSSWAEGPAGFGALGWGAKIGTRWTTSDIWLRKRFTLKAKPAGPVLRIFHDEDVEVYLNGILACRDGGFLTGYDDFEIDAAAAASLKPGENVIAVHCRQTAGGQFIDVGLVEQRESEGR